jgi:hypothetical protein
LIWPIGRRTTRTLAGATGESWSSIVTTFGMRLAVLSLTVVAEGRLSVPYVAHDVADQIQTVSKG